MPIAPLSNMIAEAQRDSHGLCYCESWNLESLEAVIEAAEECGSPIIAGFNGGFLRHCSRAKPEDLACYACFRHALERSSVPVAFLLNESDSLDQIEEGIHLGFNAVMLENAGLAIDTYREMVRAVVAIARPKGVWVEAQIGTLPYRATGCDGEGTITDPELADQFVAETGINALAVSVGNVHVLTRGKASVDWDVLSRVRERVRVPLVVHGGTSLSPESLQRLIREGVAKINFGTVLKQVYLEAVRKALSHYRSPASPHKFLGMGGPEDVMTVGREAVKSKVTELLQLCRPQKSVAL